MTIQAGMLLAMTGAGSFYGKVMSHGAQLAAAQIKAAGGFDYHISIGDHKSGDVPSALSATRQMISQNHIEVLQTSYGAPSEAIVPLIGQNKVLSFNGGGSSPGQVGKPYLWQTRMLFGDDPCPGGLAWIHQQFPGAKRLAIIGTQENGVAGAKTIGPECWKNLTGGPVVTNLQHQVGATDYSSIIAQVKAQNPDAILTFSYGNDVGYEIKQFREANVKVPIMGIDFTAQAATIAGATIDTYNFCSDYYDVDGPSPFNKILVAGHRKMFGNDPEYYGANYYEQVFFVWQIVRRVLAAGGNPLDSAQLEKSLEKDPTFYTVYGGTPTQTATVKFNLSDHTITKPMGVFKIVNGKPVEIAKIKKISSYSNPKSALISG